MENILILSCFQLPVEEEDRENCTGYSSQQPPPAFYSTNSPKLFFYLNGTGGSNDTEVSN